MRATMGGVTRARARRPPPRASPRHTHPLTRRSRVVERSRARSDGVQPPRAPPRARDVPNASHRDREVFFMYSLSPDSLCTPTTRPRRGYTHAPARPTDRARERYDPARRRDRGFTTRVESSPARFVDVDATGDLSVRRPSIDSIDSIDSSTYHDEGRRWTDREFFWNCRRLLLLGRPDSARSNFRSGWPLCTLRSARAPGISRSMHGTNDERRTTRRVRLSRLRAAKRTVAVVFELFRFRV